MLYTTILTSVFPMSLYLTFFIHGPKSFCCIQKNISLIAISDVFLYCFRSIWIYIWNGIHYVWLLVFIKTKRILEKIHDISNSIFLVYICRNFFLHIIKVLIIFNHVINMAFNIFPGYCCSRSLSGFDSIRQKHSFFFIIKYTNFLSINDKTARSSSITVLYHLDCIFNDNIIPMRTVIIKDFISTMVIISKWTGCKYFINDFIGKSRICIKSALFCSITNINMPCKSIFLSQTVNV